MDYDFWCSVVWSMTPDRTERIGKKVSRTLGCVCYPRSKVHFQTEVQVNTSRRGYANGPGQGIDLQGLWTELHVHSRRAGVLPGAGLQRADSLQSLPRHQKVSEGRAGFCN